VQTTVTTKSLDEKLARIRSGKYTPSDFIIADAKDADMGFGLTAPGPAGGTDGRTRSRAEYLDAMRALVREELVDVMLMSASSAEALADEGLFDASAVTPAVRLNDTTDIWFARGSRYREAPSRPFRTASLDRVVRFCDLGLYSITFSNDVERDLETLEAFARFREEAAAAGIRYFLEVFNPAFDVGAPDLGAFVNDAIVRSLAGVVSADRPLFLKIAYNGPRALEELAAYDPENLIVGVLGGARGTTRDAFELAAQAERHGARVALFGRKINLAEDPAALVTLLRQVVERAVSPEQAVREYHAGLARNGIRSDRPLEEDVEIADPSLRA
jgi:DhnA family fructose-bisphosphate aldolase class Ia